MPNQTEDAYCNRCRRVTTWKLGARATCTGCRTKFPCDRPCQHVDCQEKRGEVAPDKDGVLRPVQTATGEAHEVTNT